MKEFLPANRNITVLLLACSGLCFFGVSNALAQAGSQNARLSATSEASSGASPGSDDNIVAGSRTMQSFVLVAGGDTLWSIASRYKDNNHSVAQVMIAFLRANPGAFIENNINGLKVGAILRVPGLDELNAKDAQKAYSEVLLQNELWDEHIARITSVSPVATSEDAEGYVGELSLVAPAADDAEFTETGDSGEVNELRTKLALSEEELEMVQTEKMRLKSRIAELQARIPFEAGDENKLAPSAAADINQDTFDVRLSATGELTIPGLPGVLKVEIAPSGSLPEPSDTLVTSQDLVPAIQGSAIVEPFSNAFDIDPAESQCIKVHATGSTEQFKITPLEVGTFEIGANIRLFETPDCSGTHVPKTAKTLVIEVKVNREKVIDEKIDELGDVFWKRLLDFWGALVAIVFGLVLFLIRGKLKNIFGFKESSQ